jgi:phospholipid/cholesterol/gamma-HCH transport system permease protein
MDMVIGFVRDVGAQLELLAAVVARLPAIMRRRTLVAEQLYQAGIRVVHVVLLVGLFIGMIVSLQTGLELRASASRTRSARSWRCRCAARWVRSSPTILAATVGSALAAELGTMAVSEELAALEVMSIDKLRYLVLPRVVGLSVMCPLLTILCNTVGIIGGGFIAGSQLNVGVSLYYDSAIDALQASNFIFDLPKDVYSGLFKAFVFGVVVAIISCGAGIRASSGALGVGKATSKAVRDSIIAIIVTNYFLSWFFFQN